MNQHHKTIIIGAGLCGLYAAWKLYQQKHDVIILDARNYCGGRILSVKPDPTYTNYIDLGPSWVWPQYQFRLKKLLNDSGLLTFKQFTQGDMLFESAAGKIERYNCESAHNQSYRISGGSVSLINALVSRLPANIIKLNTLVQSIQQLDLSIQAKFHDKSCEYTADNIILALPPRVALNSINFSPKLPDDTKKIWNQTPTWMAIHSKIIFIYAKPFWRDKGLSGEVFSHRGPLSEIYDASPEDESYFALSSFIGLSALQRKEISEDELKQLSLTQLKRLFGDDSQNIDHIIIKDWSLDENTTTPEDLKSIMKHPDFPQDSNLHLWNKKILLAGTEVAKENAGYLEGALESAEIAIKNIAVTTKT